MKTYEITKHTTVGHIENGKRITLDKQEVVMTVEAKTGASALRIMYAARLYQTDKFAYVGKKVIYGSDADTKYTAKTVTA